MRRAAAKSITALALTLAACGQGGITGSSTDSAGTTADTESAATSTGITGVARDAATGRALQGVTVSDGRHTATTGDTGSYLLAEVAGSYTLTAARAGYRTATQKVRVVRGQRATANWSLAASAAVACTYAYGPWEACQSNGQQTRSVLTTSPDGCTGTPVTSQPCTPTSGGGTGGGSGGGSGGGTGGTPAGASYKVFANNDLGMHCVDKSFAVFSILPPYNVVDAQVVALQASGLPVVLDGTQVSVRYSAVADPAGSVNSTSIGKSDFWQFAQPLYGAALAPGQGLQGLWMPKDAPTAAGTTLAWDPALGLFKAAGIPIFPVDDAGQVNRYPLLRFTAYSGSQALGSTDVVLPVSEETSCQSCHATGRSAAPAGVMAWASDADLEAQARKNVLILHDARTGTSLKAPVLCATCHYSPALDLAGTGAAGAQTTLPTMSSAMHAFHATKMAGYVDSAVAPGGTPPSAPTQACYQCHPGASTQCLRGAMTQAVDCQNCHGNMAAVGGLTPLRAGGSIDGTNDGKPRRPWLDLPRCQSCHANDATGKTTLAGTTLSNDGLRFVYAFVSGDASASPILATNTRFAEEPGKLYRKSKGHGGLACEACHGSTHAIWGANANDNVAATQLQGHAGTIGECSACHLAAPTGLGGPHGMHPVGDAWVSAHPAQAHAGLAACRACHGADDRGTVLSRMFSTRTLAGKTLAAGTAIGCYTCHNGPNP